VNKHGKPNLRVKILPADNGKKGENKNIPALIRVLCGEREEKLDRARESSVTHRGRTSFR